MSFVGWVFTRRFRGSRKMVGRVPPYLNPEDETSAHSDTLLIDTRARGWTRAGFYPIIRAHS